MSEALDKQVEYNISDGFFESYSDRPNAKLIGLYNRFIPREKWPDYGIELSKIRKGDVVRELIEIPKDPDQIAHKRIVIDALNTSGKGHTISTIREVVQDVPVGKVTLHKSDVSMYDDKVKPFMEKGKMWISVKS